MAFWHMLCIFVLLQCLYNCHGERGIIGDDLAILKQLRRSLTVGWSGEFIESPEALLPEVALQSRQNDGETLGQIQKRLMKWHLAKGPLQQFNKWDPPDENR